MRIHEVKMKYPNQHDPEDEMYVTFTLEQSRKLSIDATFIPVEEWPQLRDAIDAAIRHNGWELAKGERE